MSRYIIHFFVLFLSFVKPYLQGELRGKVDLGPILMDVDILESGKTVKTLHMKGVKGDATILIYEGLCIKPGFIWGSGHGELTGGSIAVGYYLPITKNLKILPNVGMTWSYLRTRINWEDLQLFNLKERFRSDSPFIGMEICYSITDKLTLMGVYQYAWSRTDTKIRSNDLGTLVSDKSHSSGPNYSLGLDYSFNCHWSVLFGVGYNLTLSKEKHGIRGKGVKLGIAYYF